MKTENSKFFGIARNRENFAQHMEGWPVVMDLTARSAEFSYAVLFKIKEEFLRTPLPRKLYLTQFATFWPQSLQQSTKSYHISKVNNRVVSSASLFQSFVF